MPKAFFVGIKGVGMTALACILDDLSWDVAGSDTGESFITDQILSKRNIEVSSRITSFIPADTDLVIYSGAYDPPDTNVRTLSLAEALAEFVNDRKIIAIAGVGGKTTTSAMLAVLMQKAGRDVGYYIGTSDIKGLDAPGSAGSDPYFVVEADEYAISKHDKRPKFALFSPQILVTTNILNDHPDIYPDEAATLAFFTELVRKMGQGTTWICSADDPLTQKILSQQEHSLKDIKIIQYSTKHNLYGQLDLQVFGEQNRLDALAAVLAAIDAGLTEREALEAMHAYRGAKRRQEFIGEVKGRLLYDDYGHHPHEITATVRSFRQEFPDRRLVLIFESHTYSRTEALFAEFAQALSHADLVFVMPIFESAREKGQTHSVSSNKLAQEIDKLGTPAQAVSWENAAELIIKASKEGDLLLTMGAGFVYKLHTQFRKMLAL